MAADRIPNPGSDQAREGGCRCPVIDNGHGHGYGVAEIDGKPTPVFVMRADCPLHGIATNYDWRDASPPET